MPTRRSALALAALLVSAPVFANFHQIYVVEVFAGTAAAPNAQYILLQAYQEGQDVVGGHSVFTYDSTGAPTGTFTFAGPVSHDENQMHILVATPEAATLFNVTADLAMTPALSPAGGKVCWDTQPYDCVAWGNYTGPAADVGTPAGVPVGIERGTALKRRLDIAGLPSVLDPGDDLPNSSDDFVVGSPAPVNNASQSGSIPASTCGNNVLEGLEQCDQGDVTAGDGCSATCTLEPEVTVPVALTVDSPSLLAPDNGVFEPGETVVVDPLWQNVGTATFHLTGTASLFTGPAGATYGIVVGSRDYGFIGPQELTFNCDAPAAVEGTNCYTLSVSAPATRPAAHWDATFSEVLSSTAFHDWTLHIGESFPDVPTSLNFYPFIETLFHNGVTGGCAGGNYCPGNPVTRAQMAVFLLKAKFGAAHVPPAPTGGVFTDVPPSNPFAAWIEELASLSITGGCGPNLYCPDNTVTRQQMAVFLLKTHDGSAYDPPDCTGVFDDVPCTPGTGFSDWIEELYARGITGGCATLPLRYCPANPNNRGQMAVFLDKTFSLILYGP